VSVFTYLKRKIKIDIFLSIAYIQSNVGAWPYTYIINNKIIENMCPFRTEKWFEFLNTKNVCKYQRICSDHFEEKCLKKKYPRLLWNNAVSTIRNLSPLDNRSEEDMICKICKKKNKIYKIYIIIIIFIFLLIIIIYDSNYK